MSFLATLSPFYIFLIWIIVAVIFIVAELLTFGFILIFFGVGAVVAGLCALIFDMNFAWQLVVFIAVSIAALALLRKFSIKTFRGKENNDVDDDYHNSIMGKTAVVTKDIVPPAAGEVKYSGSFWPAVADLALKAGQTVEITARTNEDSLTLKVKAL